MIIELKIENVALISQLTFRPNSTFTVLTGETGAGKSILLGALSLILGERASADLIRANCEAASVEGLFDSAQVPSLALLLAEHGLPACEEDSLILKREFFRNGRGKCYVNGSLTTLGILQKIGTLLVDLHGQHAHQSLLHKDEQRLLLDNWAGLQQLNQQVEEAYHRLRYCKEAQAQLAMDEAERARRLDLLSFQINEIEQAELKPGEMDQLNEERRKLLHAEKIVTAIQAGLDVLHRREEGAVHDNLAATAQSLSALIDYDATLSTVVDELHQAGTLVDEVVNRLSDFIDSFEADPNRLEWIETRLDLLQKLQRKYGPDEQAMLTYHAQIQQELTALNVRDEQLERLVADEQQQVARLTDFSRRLSNERSRAGQALAQQMAQELKVLGFQQAEFIVKVTPRWDEQGWVKLDQQGVKCGPAGYDDIEFLIAPNPGETAKPVAKTASGGELSRIMLAIKVIASKSASVPTMIFDEVDAGIGGATAEAVGKRLHALADRHQVIVITHLPQIARFAGKHFQVQKHVEQGRTTTTVLPLDNQERIQELARLLAGDHITETALQHAKELIQP